MISQRFPSSQDFSAFRALPSLFRSIFTLNGDLAPGDELCVDRLASNVAVPDVRLKAAIAAENSADFASLALPDGHAAFVRFDIERAALDFVFEFLSIGSSLQFSVGLENVIVPEVFLESSCQLDNCFAKRALEHPLTSSCD